MIDFGGDRVIPEITREGNKIYLPVGPRAANDESVGNLSFFKLVVARVDTENNEVETWSES